jgi:protocatechuate 3,4-dioxygenase beta subunit
VQYEDRGDKADGRAVVESDEQGVFWFNAIVPVPYPIPDDGPVGKLLEKLGRHCWRPSHMHFMFEKPGFDNLVTYLRHLRPCLPLVMLITVQCSIHARLRLRDF